MSSRRPVPGSHNCSQSAEVLFFYLLRDSKGGAGPQTSTSRSTWDPSSSVRSLLQTSPWGSKFRPDLPGRVSKPQHTWEETTPAALIAGTGLVAINQRLRGVHCKFKSLGVTT